MVVLKKGMRPTKKKKKTNYFQEQNLNRFTNMKTVLQKCVPNKP